MVGGNEVFWACADEMPVPTPNHATRARTRKPKLHTPRSEMLAREEVSWSTGSQFAPWSGRMLFQSVQSINRFIVVLRQELGNEPTGLAASNNRLSTLLARGCEPEEFIFQLR